MPRCTSNSIRSAISSRGKSTSRDALLPWPSGELSQHRSPLARWRSRCISTSLRYFDTSALLLYAYCNGVYSSRRILTYRHQLVVSPSYLKTCKPPKEPRDLLDHRLLTFSHWKPENRWTFVHKNGMDKERLGASLGRRGQDRGSS